MRTRTRLLVAIAFAAAGCGSDTQAPQIADLGAMDAAKAVDAAPAPDAADPCVPMTVPCTCAAHCCEAGYPACAGHH